MNTDWDYWLPDEPDGVAYATPPGAPIYRSDGIAVVDGYRFARRERTLSYGPIPVAHVEKRCYAVPFDYEWEAVPELVRAVTADGRRVPR